MSKRKKDDLDGAQYPGYTNVSPDEYYTDPSTGIRPASSTAPSGTIVIDLTTGIVGKTLPPRSIWRKGQWGTEAGKDWDHWHVSGEGSPGNYAHRIYKVPHEIAGQVVPRHPADWKESLRAAKPSAVGTYRGTASQASYSSGLPWDLLIRCPGCGHFWKEADLAQHAKKEVCPVQQGALEGQPVMWVIPCKCHPDNPLATAEIMPGFPLMPKAAEDTPDKSGEEGDSNEAEGEVLEQAGEAVAPTG